MAQSLNNQFDQLHVRTTAGQQVNSPITKKKPQESAKELRKRAKIAEKREQEQRKRAKQQKADAKARARRRKVALDALVRIAAGGGPHAVSAAGKLLEYDLRG